MLSSELLEVLKNFSFYDNFISYYSPCNLAMLYSDIKSHTESRSKYRLSLNDINNVYGTEDFHAGIDYIVLWVSNLDSFTNIVRSQNEMFQLAYIIYERYSFFYLSDLKLLFDSLILDIHTINGAKINAARIISSFQYYEKSVQTSRIKQNKILYTKFENNMEQIYQVVYSQVYNKYINEFGKENISKYRTEIIRDSYHETTIRKNILIDDLIKSIAKIYLIY